MNSNFAPPAPNQQPAQSTLSTRASEVKSPTAFRTISEVATDLAVPQHVLRFWESKFQQIKPLKRGGGRRYYRPEDVQLISSIKELLYSQGFTIRGVQKLLKENGRFPSARSMVPDPQVPNSISTLHAPNSNQPAVRGGLSAEKRRDIEGVLNELRSLRDLLRQSGV
jgi:DNA-binding transcriptional MerR regulator